MKLSPGTEILATNRTNTVGKLVSHPRLNPMLRKSVSTKLLNIDTFFKTYGANQFPYRRRYWMWCHFKTCRVASYSKLLSKLPINVGDKRDPWVKLHTKIREIVQHRTLGFHPSKIIHD